MKAQEILMKDSWEKAITEVPALFCKDTLTVCFMGDVMMHSNQIISAYKSDGTYDFSSYFRLLEDRIESADIAVANMEFTLSGEPYTGYPCFSAPDCFAEYLADTGLDIFLAANNHIFDKGSAGAGRTLEIYRRLEETKGIRTTGLAENRETRNGNIPLTVRKKGISIAFLNMTYGTNLGQEEAWPKTNYMGERELLADAFKRADADGADLTIALPHWGSEYQLSHSSSQEEYAGWLAENGADLIIGTHPHVVQDISSIENVQVAYSLGNAVSNMSAANTQLGLMVIQRIARHGNGDIELLPMETIWIWCSRPGGFSENYTVIPVGEYIGRRAEWLSEWDYDKMVTTYERVRKTTIDEQTINTSGRH